MKAKKEYTTDELKDFFENEDFSVNLYEEEDYGQCGELETWTNNGVNMIPNLVPFTKESFIEYVESFNVDDEIDLYRQDKLFRDNFTISQALKDFSDYHKRIKRIAKKLK